MAVKKDMSVDKVEQREGLAVAVNINSTTPMS